MPPSGDDVQPPPQMPEHEPIWFHPLAPATPQEMLTELEQARQACSGGREFTLFSRFPAAQNPE
eukprot:1050095-Prorocentrum_lima.AAC.1